MPCGTKICWGYITRNSVFLCVLGRNCFQIWHKKPNIDQKLSIKLQILLPVEFHRNINLRIRRRTFQMSPTAKNTRWLARRIYVWMTKIKPYGVFFCRTFFAACFSFFFRKDQTKTRKIVTHQNILRKETGAQLDSLAAFVNLISTIKQRNSFDINENKGIRKLVSFELRKKNPRLCAGIMFNLATCFTLF